MAAILFGMLYQGGSEVTFDMPNITRYMFVAVQGVIILFSGALENLFRPQIEYFFVSKFKVNCFVCKFSIHYIDSSKF